MNVWEGLSRFLGKIRPQIFLALIILGVVGVMGITSGLTEITIGAITGVVALAKDVLQSDQ